MAWPLRARVLEILEQQVIPRGEIATINALGVLQAAIAMVRPRYGSRINDQIVAEWLPERRAALAVIARLIQPAQAPIVLYRIRTLLHDPVDYDGQPEFKADCAKILSAIPDTFELRIVRILLSNGWSEFYRHKTDEDGTTTQDQLKQSEEKWDRFSIEVSQGVLAEHSKAPELLSWLEAAVERLRAAGENPQPHALLYQITRQQPELAAECLDLLLNKATSPLDGTWASWFVGQRKLPDARVEKWLESVLSHDNPERWRNTLNILRGVGIGELTPGVLAAVATWAGRLRDKDLAETIESLRWHGTRERLLDEIILRNLPLERLSDSSLVKLAHALGRGLNDGTGTPVPMEFERKFLGQLLRMQTLGDHQAEDFLGNLAKRFPREFYDILHARVEMAASKRSARFKPLPYWECFSLDALSETDGYPALARSLFERYLTSSSRSMPWWRSLLHVAVMGISPLGLELVREHLPKVADEESLVRLIQALHYDGSDVIFTTPNLVRLILQRIEAVAPQKLTILRFELAHTGAPRMRSFESRDVDPEARHYREQAAKAAAINGGDTLLGAFYREIIRSEDAAEVWHREWVEMGMEEWS